MSKEIDEAPRQDDQGARLFIEMKVVEAWKVRCHCRLHVSAREGTSRIRVDLCGVLVSSVLSACCCMDIS